MIAAALFILALCAGFFGNPDAYRNLIVTAVWVVWWVGLAFVCALVGDLWEVIDPVRSLYRAVAAAVRRVGGWRRESLDFPYPVRLGAWPAALLYFGFAWVELIWRAKDVPAALAGAVLGYAALASLGMLVFGVEPWRRHADPFSITFRTLGRFAPLDVRASSAESPRRLVLRPYGAGLLDGLRPDGSMVAFVLLMLATVSFDGFQQTPSMQALETAAQTSRGLALALYDLSALALDETQTVHTLLLIACGLGFWAAYTLACCVAVACAWGGPGLREVAGASVMTLVPIAVAYHLAHYVSLLLTAGQFMIPLASDPFGWGWNLFDTRDHEVDLGIVGPAFYWYGAVLLIVFGHVLAVVAAHRAAMRLYADRRRAFRSQWPMLALMVAYTTLSLWILAQPIVG